MIQTVTQILQLLASNATVLDFYQELSSGSFLDGLFHYLLADLESGEIFVHEAASALPEYPNLGFLAAASPEVLASGKEAWTQSRGAFLEHCVSEFESSLNRFQQQKSLSNGIAL